MNKREIVCYNVDASRMKGRAVRVVCPGTVDEIRKLIEKAETDVVPRGGGTGIMGGTIPQNSIVLDMRKICKVTDFNPVKKTVHVEPGITIKELNEKLASVKFEFPIHSYNQRISTIGGMIARNATGSRSMRYGGVNEWIEQIEFVNGRGELMKARKADLMDICGMEGITGVIVGVTLRVQPLVKRTASIFQTDSLEEALSIARRLKLEREVAMLLLFPPYVSTLLGLPEKYHIIIEFDSTRGKITGEEYETIKELTDRVHYFMIEEGYNNIEDPRFFFDKVPEFISFLEENNIPYYSYLGQGVVYPFFKDDETEKQEETVKLIKKIKVKLSTHGIGLKRKYFLDNFEKKLLQRVKLRHDPFGKLQRGKVLDMEFLKRIPGKQEFQEEKDLEEPERPEIPRERKVEKIEISEKPEVPLHTGEERSVAKLLDELKQELDKSERKLKELGKPIIKGIEDSKEELRKREQEELNKELRERIADYEYTYDSELPEEKVKKVEEIAKNIPREISKEGIGKTTVSDDFNREEIEEKKLIDQIMKGEKVEAEKPSEKPSEEPSEPTEPVELRGKISDDEKSIIDRIMTNKYKGESEKKDGSRS
jgi:FAD/FMN-containing dehydrogenase